MARPSDGDSTFRPAQPRRNAPFSATQDERQRSRPEVGDESRGVAGKMKVEPVDHSWPIDQQEEWLARRPALESDQRRYRIAIYRSAESVDRFGGICQDHPVLELSEGRSDRPLYLGR
jgi:hypothetical protein